ncbi:MAG: TPM domain-containing protein [Bacilli bacterium]|nr:TPM domain-containing protein [Bacilli bacterium]
MSKKLLLFLIMIAFLSVSFVFALEDNPHNETPVNLEEEDMLYKNSNNSYEARIVDHANLLTQNEKEKLLKEMIPLTDYGNILFFSTDATTEEYYAIHVYQSFYGTSTGSLFMIDAEHNKTSIFSEGKNKQIITNYKVYSIDKSLSSYMSQKNYYGCASHAFSKFNTLLSGGIVLEPLRYASSVFIALTLSFLLSFLFLLFKYKNKTNINQEELYDFHHTQGKVTVNKTGTRHDDGPYPYNHRY